MAEIWKHVEGSPPNTVTVLELKPGGNIHGRIWDPTMGKRGAYRKVSLKHRDRKRAKEWAKRQHAMLVLGDEEARQARPTWASVFAAYQRYRTPQKSARAQKEDARRIEMWTRFLGGKRDPHDLSLREWEAFLQQRSSGETDARGRRVEKLERRRPVRSRPIEMDCAWLRAVCRWASSWRTESGKYLMRESPCRGFPMRSERNPRRPVATWERYEALRAVSDRVIMEKTRKKRESVWERSHLSEILDLAVATGRRISPICALDSRRFIGAVARRPAWQERLGSLRSPCAGCAAAAFRSS